MQYASVWSKLLTVVQENWTYYQTFRSFERNLAFTHLWERKRFNCRSTMFNILAVKQKVRGTGMWICREMFGHLPTRSLGLPSEALLPPSYIDLRTVWLSSTQNPLAVQVWGLSCARTHTHTYSTLIPFQDSSSQWFPPVFGWFTGTCWVIVLLQSPILLQISFFSKDASWSASATC